MEQNSQSLRTRDNAAQDAIAHAGNPELFQKYLDTGVDTIRTQALLQGRDPDSADHEIAQYRSSVLLLR